MYMYRTAELKRQLDIVTEELSMMRGARDRQVSMVESLVRQRDMYRVLLSESGSTPVSRILVMRLHLMS